MALLLLLVLALSAHAAHAAVAETRYKFSELYCDVRLPSTGSQLPSCINVDVSTVKCASNAPVRSFLLPNCTKIQRKNIASMPSLLCPASGTEVLPACIKVKVDNVIDGFVPGSAIKPGSLPAGITIGAANIVSIRPGRLVGKLSAANTVADDNVAVGSLPISSLASGKLNQAIILNEANFIGPLDQSKLAPGFFKMGVYVSNSNFANASLTTDIFAAGSVPASVRVTNDNTDPQSLAVDRFTCTGSSSTNLGSCLKVDAGDLVCPAGRAAGVTSLGTCMSIRGSQVRGDIAASSVSGVLSQGTISPSRLVCPANSAPMPLRTCQKIKMFQNVQCPASARTLNMLSCLVVNTTQIEGSLNNVLIPGSSVRGDISRITTTLNGLSVVPGSVNGAKFNLPYVARRVLQLRSGVARPARVCCNANTDRMVSCMSPMMVDSSFATLIVYANAAGYSIDYTNQCCTWAGVMTNSPNEVGVLMSAVCIP